MKKFGLLLVAMLVGGGIAFFAMNAKNSGTGNPFSRTHEATVKKDTSIKMILLDPLQSGLTKEGEPVRLMVAEDVKNADGSVVIPKGSRGTAKVTWSRGEDATSVLKNEPARLAIDLDTVTLNTGSSVPIGPKNDKEDKFQFDRGNTGKQNFISRLQEVWNKEDERKRLESVLDTLQRNPDFRNDQDRANVASAAKELGLDSLADTLNGQRYGELKGAVDQLQNQGSDLRKLSGTQILFAALEYRSLLGALQGTVGSVFKGRVIRAYPGTEVEAKVSSDTKVQVN